MFFPDSCTPFYDLHVLLASERETMSGAAPRIVLDNTVSFPSYAFSLCTDINFLQYGALLIGTM